MVIKIKTCFIIAALALSLPVTAAQNNYYSSSFKGFEGAVVNKDMIEKFVKFREKPIWSDFDRQNIKCIADNIYYESRGLSYNESYAITQVVFNRVDSEKFKPTTICGVIAEPKQFSWYPAPDAPLKQTEYQHYLRSYNYAEYFYFLRQNNAFYKLEGVDFFYWSCELVKKRGAYDRVQIRFNNHCFLNKA